MSADVSDRQRTIWNSCQARAGTTPVSRSAREPPPGMDTAIYAKRERTFRYAELPLPEPWKAAIPVPASAPALQGVDPQPFLDWFECACADLDARKAEILIGRM